MLSKNFHFHITDLQKKWHQKQKARLYIQFLKAGADFGHSTTKRQK